MTTTEQPGSAEAERRVSPADVQSVRFSGGSMLHPGYSEVEVDRFLNRVAQEIGRLHAEKAELRDSVHALQAQLHRAEAAAEQATVPEPPSDQAVRLLATAQQTADQYVAEAEDFSRQMTADARARFEEQLKHARETAGAIIQAAHEQAAHMTGTEERPAQAEPAQRSATTEELEEQVAYLKAFAQACRTQLRAYLEALLTDVESEWGKADPVALPPVPIRTPAQRGAPRSERAAAAPQESNVAREMPLSDATSEHPIITPEGTVEVRRT
jgi:DivIVA domain-containing protein